MNHNPFRVRTPYDKLCIWTMRNGRLFRLYCTRTYRTKSGLLGLERLGRDGRPRIATAGHAGLIDAPILIEKIA